MKYISKFLPGLIAIIITISIVSFIFLFKPAPESQKVEILPRTIRTVQAKTTDMTLYIETQGTVNAKQVIDIIPQVAGEVQYVSPDFVAGGRFKKDDILIRIDPRDYELAVITAEARIAESNQRVMQEEAEAELAKSEWEELGEGEASDLTLRKPQREGALAALKSAEAGLSQAQLDLERTVIKAPFSGILTEKNVDLGQFLNRGAKIGRFYSTEVLELRLPLTDRDLAQFDLPGLQSGSKQYPVKLTGQFANKQSTWNARLVRTEGIIDVNSRILYVVAELKGDELYSIEDNIPITIGQFVSAEIEGRSFQNVIKLPRESLRQGNQVLVVDKDHKLRTKMVNVLESNKDYIVISSGVENGDIVNLSQLGISVDGMLVEANNELNQQNKEITAASSSDNKTINQEDNND